MNTEGLPDSKHRRESALAGSVAIVAAAALAVAPQLIWGDSCGHDFDFHFVSWFDALNSWRHGILYPHWTPSANFGAGEPRFVFYSPLTWMLGAALDIVLQWNLVPIALTFVLLTGAGLATRALAREKLPQGAATLAGCIAIFCGYPLFTAYERSAFAELAGGIWIPLVLLYGLRNHGTRGSGSRYAMFNGSIVPLAVAIAGAWLSNPTVGVMACYTLAALALVSAGLLRSWKPIVRCVAGASLGMGLSAIYLLPAAFEQRWVDIREVTEDLGQTLENNWLFARHVNPDLAFHDQVLHTASMIAVAMIAVTICAVIVCWLWRLLPGEQSWWIPLAIIPFAVLLLQFSFSDVLWNLLPDLRFLQFPWRWLLVLEAPLAVFLASALWPRTGTPRVRIVAAVACSAAFVCATAGAGRYLYQACYAEDTVPGMLGVLRSGQGYNGTNEYEPLGAEIARIPMGLPEACLVRDPNTVLGRINDDGVLAWNPTQGSCEATYSSVPGSGPEHLRIRGESPHSGFLIVRQLTFPAWRITTNGQAAESRPARKDGLTVVPVQRGSFELAFDWVATGDVILARWLSALSVLALTCVGSFERRAKQPRL